MLNVEFAPIQGYTEFIYRNLHNEIFGGIDCYYSPFIRLENHTIRNKDIRDVDPANNININFTPQIIVNGAEEFSTLVDYLSDLNYRRIDINMGCPFPLQTKKGRGAALLTNSDKFNDVCRCINKYSEIEFSIKMRLGMYSSQESITLLNIINDLKLHHLTIHPRIANQQYKGSIDHDSFRYIYDNTNHRIIYNGDITTIKDIRQIEQLYPNLYGIMIGRGLLTNPSLAQEYINNTLLTDSQRLSLVLQMHNKIFDYYSTTLQGEHQLLLKMKTFWEHLENIIGKKAYKSIKKSSNIHKYENALSLIWNNH